MDADTIAMGTLTAGTQDTLTADRIQLKDLQSGIEPLDALLRGNIITLRCTDTRWLFELTAGLLVRNHEPGMKALYLHWVDYHKRFWTLDYDYIFRLAKKCGCDSRALSLDTYFVRAFSRDNNEVEANWVKLLSYGKFDLIILDSVSELYCEAGRSGRGDGGWKQDAGNQKPMTYSIGKFVQLCIKNGCPGLILDYSGRLHPYLAHVSSVILEFYVDKGEVFVHLMKHPSLPDAHFNLPRDRQYRLRRWM